MLKNKKKAIKNFDVILSLILLLFLLIPLTILIILKLIADGRPLFYNSIRIGQYSVPFKVYKFRTMVNDREAINDYLSRINSFGFEKIPIEAPIYTGMGRFFEKFQIVEMLQLFNVLKGNMSIIGYRPLPDVRVKQLENELGKELVQLRHSQLPGITGYTQIIGKLSLTNLQRIELENDYNLFLEKEPQFKMLVYNFLILSETVLQILFNNLFFLKYLKSKISNEIQILKSESTINT